MFVEKKFNGKGVTILFASYCHINTRIFLRCYTFKPTANYFIKPHFTPHDIFV